LAEKLNMARSDGKVPWLLANFEATGDARMKTTLWRISLQRGALK